MQKESEKLSIINKTRRHNKVHIAGRDWCRTVTAALASSFRPILMDYARYIIDNFSDTVDHLESLQTFLKLSFALTAFITDILFFPSSTFRKVIIM